MLAHVADRLLNRPLLLTPDKASVILAVLAGRIGLEEGAQASRFVGEAGEIDGTGRGRALPYRRTTDGVAIVSITGSLVNRGAWLGSSSGLQSYEGIKHQLAEAGRDNQVSSVILDLQTPGGEAVGAFETAEAVRSLAARKRVVAVVNGMACSAGYAIASGASEIVTTESGVSGSIGVLMVHADMSRKLDQDGISPTLIFAGAHKVDGNPFEPLSAEVRGDLQREVNGLYALFVETVAKGRGNRLTTSAARKTEARALIGREAVQAGLADRMGTFETVLSELSRARSGRSNVQKRRSSMDPNDVGQSADNGAQARRDEQARIKAIVTSAEGQKLPNLASHLAYDTDLGSDEAGRVLEAAGKDVGASASRSQRMPTLAERMASDTPIPFGADTMTGRGGGPGAQPSSLVETMKQRHGVK